MKVTIIILLPMTDDLDRWYDVVSLSANWKSGRGLDRVCLWREKENKANIDRARGMGVRITTAFVQIPISVSLILILTQKNS